MAPLKSIMLAALFAASALGAPSAQRRQAECKTIKQRKAWHTLSADEKKAYIDAELCLMSKPAKAGLRGAKTMFDEFQALHVVQAELRHFTGSFLPWHRTMMWAHEHLLETECGYKGAQPFWQEEKDAGAFLSSEVMDPETGFGGDGVRPEGCIVDGPFANYTNSVGPSYEITDHCITRRVSERFSRAAAPAQIENCLRQQNYISVWACIEGSPHSAGHGGIGAQMVNVQSSPGDPIFYLHHTWLDKIWWDWQAQDLEVRLTDIGGRNKGGFGGGFGRGFGGEGGAGSFVPPNFGRPGAGEDDEEGADDDEADAPGGFGGGFGGGFPGFPGFGGGEGGGGGFGPIQQRPDDVPEPLPRGDEGSEVTLSHINDMAGIIDDLTVEEIMDIRSSPMCYEYVDPPPLSETE